MVRARISQLTSCQASRLVSLRTSTSRAVVMSSVAALLAASVLFAGPLTPPAGPVTSTNKTLTEVEPRTAINLSNTPGDADSLFKITQPGSYYLTGNITGVVGKHGIEIAASGVTLDLKGFDLVGVAGMGAFDGVRTSTTEEAITVMNGSIRSWGASAVRLQANATVSNIKASNNGSTGISTASASTIRDCIATGNGGSGIAASADSVIVDCVASSNTNSGIFASTRSTIERCVSNFNSGNGVSSNGNSRISGCSATSNGSSGFFTGGSCIVTSCTSSSNTAHGFFLQTASFVEDCIARSNAINGIYCTTSCVVRGNLCSGNGAGTGDGANIYASASDNRIEGNNCTGADRGVEVISSGNIIVRNTCSGNTTNWDIAANNIYGPIIDRVGAATAAVLGNGAVSALGSTDANANFTY